MSSYIHFTEEQKQRAAAVDLEEFLRCRGEKLLSSGREKRLASDHSVTVRGNEWYDHAEERGGHAVSFVQRFYGLSYPDAVTLLLGGELGTAYPSAGERTEEPVKPFALPPANKEMRRVFAYPMRTRLRLFLEWGITFEEPYIVPERADRAVAYANREDLEHNLPKSNKAENADMRGTYAVSGRGGIAHEPAVDKPRRRGGKQMKTYGEEDL